MYFQKVLKGIRGLSTTEATDMVNRHGITSNWWKRKRHITSEETMQQLTDANVINHLNRYDDPLPPGHPYGNLSGARTYGDVTPYISTTAGAVQRHSFNNITFPSFMTALQFATGNFTTNGFIFYAYVITLGKKAVPLAQFAEEVRELHIYQQFLPYHQEGEIVAKIGISSAQIERAEEYHGSNALNDLQAGIIPMPANVIFNTTYVYPEQYSNIRELI